ncbi:ABC transporter ATP-binding protein [Allohahella sp. A8]|uniref:ABC transporter ATP-binding protein n=1 Tax=Allohahella sp. A8 TaxID=3141461 RepID=UPI003A810E34
MMAALLDVRDLRVAIQTERGAVYPVQGASFTVDREETLCIVGESGCGKSVSMLAVLGLLGRARVEAERLHFTPTSEAPIDLANCSQRELRRLRGRQIGLIFQDAAAAFNPVLPVGDQLAEPLRVHLGMSRGDAKRRAVQWLERVGIIDPAKRAKQYPHEFSGGMLQRAMIAMALICEPSLVIADEPTTALDVSVQAEILDLLNDLKRTQQIGLIMITHDLGVVAEIADSVTVMYAGQSVERASKQSFFQSLKHPYSQALLACTPNWKQGRASIEPIPGAPPALDHIQTGCPFRFRCPHAWQRCEQMPPPFEANGHMARCWLLASDAGPNLDRLSRP